MDRLHHHWSTSRVRSLSNWIHIMSPFKLSGLGSLMVLMASGLAAQAADLPVAYQPVAPAPVPSLSGFYLGTITTLNWLDNTSFGISTPGLATIDTDYDMGFYTGL